MLRYFLITWFVLHAAGLTAQETEFEIIKLPGDSLREEGDLKAAIDAYREDYIKDPRAGVNTYNFACALAIYGMADSAFKYIDIALSLDSGSAQHFITDPDFISLKDHKSWKQAEDKAVAIMTAKSGKTYKDLAYAKVLWKMKALDQAYYSDLNIAEKKVGRYSSVVRALWDLKRRINEQNQKDLENLIQTKGWPKESEVGRSAAGTAFLIIQHSDIEKQKKYLPVIEQLCKDKEASWQSYALMYDRIQTSEDKPQKYGSQVRYSQKAGKYELFPLLDASKVDEWRKELGMGPLADYVGQWNIKFEPPRK